MIREEIKAYIETNIIPRYKNFDAAHQIEHVNLVIDESLRIAKEVEDINIEMVYVAAAYHDLGLAVDRKTHHLESEKILLEDSFLRNYFSDEEIRIMARAARDHRASGETPESRYGMIVSDADRDYNFDNVIIRCINFRKELDFFESFKEVRLHIKDKYHTNGYLKPFYFKEKPREIQEKFDLFSEDIGFALEEFRRIYGPLIFGMEIIAYFDTSNQLDEKLVITREASRAIVRRENQLLMAHLENAGEYKFPGGGIDEGENRIDCLKRELLEEAGIINSSKIMPFGVVLQKQDSIMEDAFFYQKSFYYFVDDFEYGEFNENNLDEYELEFGLKPVWVDLDKALLHNKVVQQDENKNPWVDRETLVLQLLKEIE